MMKCYRVNIVIGHQPLEAVEIAKTPEAALSIVLLRLERVIGQRGVAVANVDFPPVEMN